jgi:hypothetical protein
MIRSHALKRSREALPMPKPAHLPITPCDGLLSGGGIEQNQSLDPDRFLPRAREGDGRFAKGHSGNPGGRPPGIPNPRRRMTDFSVRPPSGPALAQLLDRKPHLLQPLAGQLLPPAAAASDPADRLGIELVAVRSSEQARHALSRAMEAVSRGEIAIAEAAQIARRVGSRLRALRRLARLQRRLAEQKHRLG